MFEARRQGAVYDLFGRQIGQGAFERLGGGNAGSAVCFGHHQQHAVPNILAPNFPGVAGALGVVGNVFGLRAGHHQQHDLRAPGLLKSGEPGVKRLQLRAVERAGGVDHVPRQRRQRF